MCSRHFRATRWWVDRYFTDGGAGDQALPYGSKIKNEWGSYIYEDERLYCLGPSWEGNSSSVPFSFFSDNRVPVTPNGNRIVEFIHTHPNSGMWDNSRFSVPRGKYLGDVGIAEKYQTSITMRIGNSIRIYEPSSMNPVKSTLYDSESHPGRTLCSENCF